MPMRNAKNHSESWREALKFISKCPICSTVYDTEKAELFAKNESASLVHITCPSCESSFVAMILMLGHGLSSVGMVTDLNLPDVKRLYQASAITTDETIEGFELFQNNQKFSNLLLNRK